MDVGQCMAELIVPGILCLLMAKERDQSSHMLERSTRRASSEYVAPRPINRGSKRAHTVSHCMDKARGGISTLN